MKKHFIQFLLLSSVITLSSCSWEIPESVSVKSKAEYHLGLGNVEKSLSDYFSVSEMKSNFSTMDGMEIYDYNPGGNSTDVQSFLVKTKIKEIPVDFSSYFESLDLNNSIKGLSFEKSISVPSFNATVTQDIELTPVTTALNALATISGTTSTSAQSVTFSGISATASFESLTYSSGTYLISAAANGSVTLAYNGSEIATATFSNGQAKLNLTGKTIYSSGMTITFSESSGQSFEGIIQDGVISSAANVTNTAVSLDTVNKELTSVSSGFESCVVGAGSLDFVIATTEVGTGINLNYSTTLSGGISYGGTPITFTQTTTRQDLAGATITTAAIQSSTSLSIAFTNANIDLTKKLKLSATPVVTNYASVTVTTTGITRTVNQTTALSGDITKYLKSITFGENTGLTGTYENGLPAGNDVTLKNVTCSFLGISNKTQTLSGATNASIDIKSGVETTSTISSGTSITFSAELELPGQNADGSKMTVTNINAGSDYKIKVDIKPNIDWTSITVNSSSATQQQNQIDTGLSLGDVFDSLTSSFGSDIASKINITSLPLYVYCTKPDSSAFDTLGFTGKVEAFMGTSSNGSVTKSAETYFVGSASEDGTMTFVSLPDFGSTDKVVTFDVSQKSYSAKGDLKSVLNDRNLSNASLYIDYNLALSNSSGGSEITLTKASLNSTSNCVIGLYAVLQLDLKFDVTSQINIDVMKLVGSSDTKTDIFGRESASSNEEMTKYLSAIQDASVHFKTSELPLKSSGSVKFYVDLTGKGKGQEISFEEGTITADVNEMLETYPCSPSLECRIPVSTFSIPRDPKINLTLDVAVTTDGTIKLTGGEE